jgi:hypothetical protein
MPSEGTAIVNANQSSHESVPRGESTQANITEIDRRETYQGTFLKKNTKFNCGITTMTIAEESEASIKTLDTKPPRKHLK